MTAAKRGSFGTRGDKDMENSKNNGTVIYYDKDHRIWHDERWHMIALNPPISEETYAYLLNEYDYISSTYNCPVCGGDVEVKDVIHTENERILMFQCGHCNYRKNFVKEIGDESE